MCAHVCVRVHACVKAIDVLGASALLLICFIASNSFSMDRSGFSRRISIKSTNSKISFSFFPTFVLLIYRF